jgi:hypothetical protein
VVPKQTSFITTQNIQSLLRCQNRVRLSFKCLLIKAHKVAEVNFDVSTYINRVTINFSFIPDARNINVSSDISFILKFSELSRPVDFHIFHEVGKIVSSLYARQTLPCNCLLLPDIYWLCHKVRETCVKEFHFTVVANTKGRKLYKVVQIWPGLICV